MRILRAADHRVMPWKNGGGTTTEIVVSPVGASMDDFDWRVSMAHVGGDGAFSSFPGIDRTLSVLRGEGIELAFGDGETVRLDRSSAPFRFAADRAVEGKLLAGPIDDLNVMSRRGRWAHALERLTGPGTRLVTVEAGLLLVIAPDGGWIVDGQALAAGDAAIIEQPASLTLAAEGDAALFAVRITAAA
jgi:environmental stress-induced protein Ves